MSTLIEAGDDEGVSPRSLATVTVEETDEGSVVILRTDRGALIRYGPFSPEGVELAIMHLGSARHLIAAS